MKTIKIPDPVDIKDENGEVVQTLIFANFVEGAIDQYKPFGQGVHGARQGQKIYNLFFENKQAESVEMEDADYAALKKAVEGATYIPRYARQFVKYFEAFE